MRTALLLVVRLVMSFVRAPQRRRPSILPASSTHSYFASTWSLLKRVDYARGGDRGTWRGSATFEDRQDRLRLVETGAFFFDRHPEKPVNMAAKALIFDFERGTVFFDDDPPALFYTFDPSKLRSQGGATFSHPCGHDTYRGTMRIDDKDHFSIRWTVSGPRKHGTIHHHYTRT